MRKKNSTPDFFPRRAAAIMAAFRAECSKAKVIRMWPIARRIADSPAERFWVSEERAAIVVSALLSGRGSRYLPPHARASKKEMYAEILSRVKNVLSANPLLSIAQAVSQVVHSPAPKFYMEPRTVIDIISSSRRN